MSKPEKCPSESRASTPAGLLKCSRNRCRSNGDGAVATSHWRRHHLTILPLQGISAKIPQRSGLRSAEQNNEFTVNVHVAERIFMLTSCR